MWFLRGWTDVMTVTAGPQTQLETFGMSKFESRCYK